MRALVIYSDVLQALNLQSHLQCVNPQITQLLGHSDFSPASRVVRPLGISLDFSPASTCGQPASACILPELVEVELCPLWALWEWGCHGRPHPSLQACMLTTGLQSWMQAPSCAHPQLRLGLDHTPAPSGCLCTTNPSPLLGSVLWSWSFSTQLPSTPADLCLKLWSTGQWHGLSVLVSLFSACCMPAAVLFSEPLKLPLCPSWFPCWRRGS